ncbi:MAG: response regulator [Candidatus Sulfotelmatobacter sp.]
MGLSVIVLESDSNAAQSLAGRLSSHFNSVQVTRSGQEFRERVAKTAPAVVILDMECSRLSDVRNLHQDFPSIPIVCTHRLPDDQLWIAAMEAGASDVCATGDVQKVLSSALRNVALSKGAAA